MTKINLLQLGSLSNEQTALSALNSNFTTLETESDNFLSRDGESPNQMEADLDMNSHKLLNLPEAMSGTEPVRKREFDAAVSESLGLGVTGPGFLTVSPTNGIVARSIVGSGSISVANGDGDSGDAEVTFSISGDLGGIDALNTTGIATRTATDTWTTRTITGGTSISVTNGDGIAGNPQVAIGGTGDVAAIEALTGTGFLARTADNTWALRTFDTTAAGVSINNPGGVAADPVVVMDNDLGAVEALSTTGIAVRTGADTWSTRTITGPAAGLTVAQGNGIAGDPTLTLANDLNALEALAGTGFAVRTNTDTWTNRSIQSGNSIVVTNGSGVAGDPIVNLYNISNNRVMSNISGGTAAAVENTLTATIDSCIGGTQGQILYRGAGAWSALNAGTNGQALVTQGAGANPTWMNSKAVEEVFTTSGTWTKSANARIVYVEVSGGGGGGGSGGRFASGTASSGGGGGGGGSVTSARFDATDLGATETVTVGAGGTYGAHAGTDTTAGVAGGNGGNSSLGTWLTAFGGGGGAGGQSAANSGGGGGGGMTAGTAGSGSSAGTGGLLGGNGGSGVVGSNVQLAGGGGGGGSSGAAGNAGGSSYNGNAGGGAGGGVTAAPAFTAGGSGGFTMRRPTALIGGLSSGTNGQTVALAQAGGGRGGGGGASSASAAAGHGGNGETPGGGGGGGGSAINGQTAGSGGDGGSGWVRVITFY